MTSDGVHTLSTDKELLEISQEKDSFIEAIKEFNHQFTENEILDDYTLLGLKVINTTAMVFDRSNNQKQVSEQIDIFNSDLPEIRHHESYDDKVIYETEEGPSKFRQSISIFFQSYGMGLLIGIFLLILFWIIFIGF